MNTHERKFPMLVSRRQIMIGAAGLSFAITLGGGADAAEIASEPDGQALTPWVSIAPDGTITIMSAASEMGQGSMTSLPLIIAEELDADWSKVKIVPAPVNEKNLRQSGFRRHDVYRRLECGEKLLRQFAVVWGAGAPGAAR
jgi:isoquinoline 1-oxidoreductase subunit beta